MVDKGHLYLRYVNYTTYARRDKRGGPPGGSPASVAEEVFSLSAVGIRR